MLKALIIEKDPGWKEFLSSTLSASFKISYWTEGKDDFENFKVNHYSVVILDLQSNHEKSFDLLKKIRPAMPHIPIIVTCEEEKAELVVRAIKSGAFDFIVKPFSAARITHVVQQALKDKSFKNEIDYLRGEQDIIYNVDRIIAYSPPMQAVIASIKKFTDTDATILMTGETGTGKSFLSGTIHFNSHRRAKPFVKINCSNIPETLLESDLFGHEKGSFTNADKQRIGRFEQAHGGTLFLDEIGEISPALQAKLLRVLEEKSFERVGGNQTIYADVRVIAATNRNLKQLMTEGKFREDLYYRINVLFIELPPLKERAECIEPLAYSILNKTCIALKKKITEFSPAAMEWIQAYHWPGNIRQLTNTIERAVILEDGAIIQKTSIVVQENGRPQPPAPATFSKPLETSEKELILQALQDSLWIQKDAARRLNISPRTLNYKIKKFKITHHRWRKNQ
ncbi:MAG: sigma-54 dependent transcriptional regulator [Desulfobacterales bacterium]|nr:sigma-54 dependent transcriptional regulator [Desulfobacterales bacterium]